MSYLKDKSLLLKSDIYESDHCAIQKDESVCCGGQDFWWNQLANHMGLCGGHSVFKQQAVDLPRYLSLFAKHVPRLILMDRWDERDTLLARC